MGSGGEAQHETHTDRVSLWIHPWARVRTASVPRASVPVLDGVLSLMRYYFRSSMTVLPIRIGIPGWSGIGTVSRCRSR
ncbi:hypothetical protein GCM10009760_11520 [Kitasatospora kazusensis]|uniref:Uncharacterized protein n=1 Tax=Kitasatospora kazusensis TaxID=407974 RepID=A0ABP5KPY5_9ACTN